MEMRHVTAQGIPYEAWKDNEYIEKLVTELQESGKHSLNFIKEWLVNKTES